MLARYDLPALFFVTTDFLDNRRLFYRNKYSLCMTRLQAMEPSRLDKVLATVSTRFDAAPADLSTLLRWLRSLNYAQEEILDEMCAFLDIDVPGFLDRGRPYMTTEEVRALATAGHTIGAHGLRHSKLNTRWQAGNDLLVHTPGDLIDDRHGVGVLHLDDAKTNGGFSIEARELPEIGQTVLNIGKIT